MRSQSTTATRQASPRTAGLRALATLGLALLALLAAQESLRALDQAFAENRAAARRAEAAPARLSAFDPRPGDGVALVARRLLAGAHPVFDRAPGTGPERPRPAALAARAVGAQAALLLRNRARRPPPVRRSPPVEAHLVAHLPQGPPARG